MWIYKKDYKRMLNKIEGLENRIKELLIPKDNDATVQKLNIEEDKEDFKMVYKLFRFTCYTYCQGTRDRGEDYVLIRVPNNATLNNNISFVIQQFHRKGSYEIDFETIKCMTAFW